MNKPNIANQFNAREHILMDRALVNTKNIVK